jgi:glycosyltransferase involved in cell wall biosynthesis
MLGTSTLTKGGISSVVLVYERYGLFRRLPVTYLATHSDASLPAKLFTLAMALAKYLWWMLTKRRYVLHVHTSSRNSFWRKCLFMVPAFALGRPVLLHLHGSEFMQFYENECGAIRRRMVRMVFDKCSRVLVLSQSWQRNVRRITANPNVEVLKNPAPEFTGSFERRGTYNQALLFLGRLGQRKGIHVLLAAMCRLKSSFPQVELLCGGDGDLEAIGAELSKLELTNSVKLLGWVTEEDRNRLLESCEIFVLPSYDEGVPMSILEAMSAGLPIVSTPVGGIPEVVRQGVDGLLVPPGDSNALANALAQLLHEPELRKRMGRNARSRFLSQHGAQGIMQRLEEIYREYGIRPIVEGAGSKHRMSGSASG